MKKEMGNSNDILAEQQRELERIRRKRSHAGNMDSVRKVLNIAFLVLAFAGVVLYFYQPERHAIGWSLIGIGMGLKVIEFFIRFMF